MKRQSIVILTGAGISAESGISTFRDGNGLWCEHHIEDVATPEGFERNPVLVHQFYNMRRAQLKEVVPNAAHLALAQLAAQWQGDLCLITQNVDDLHERGSEAILPNERYQLLHMHGELKKARCLECESIAPWEENMNADSVCPSCNTKNTLRPHIVWFGEMPFHMELIEDTIKQCDLFISIGTSGNVYPAAGFVQTARLYGHAHTIELNLEPSMGRSLFHEHIDGPATKVVPEYVQRILRGEVIEA